MNNPAIKTFVRDDDGHWYCIPKEDLWEFVNDVENSSEGDFDYKWDYYRLNGGVEGISVIVVGDE